MRGSNDEPNKKAVRAYLHGRLFVGLTDDLIIAVSVPLSRRINDPIGKGEMMKHRVLNILVPILFAAALVWGYFNVLPTPANAQDGSTPVNPDRTIQNGYSEAPMLAALVAAGQLPPVGERLPLEENIVVITPVDGVGIYGGIWHDVTPWGDVWPDGNDPV